MKTLMMIRKMKEVLTWVWIVVIGAAICQKATVRPG